MNLSKELKRRRDSEKRLEQSSPQKVIVYNSQGQSQVVDLSKFLEKAVIKLNNLQGDISIKAGDNITLNIVDNDIEISSTGGGSGGASTFIDLTDTPIEYEGEQGKFLRVNSTEDALEFVAVLPGSGASNFLELSDTPSIYTGQTGKIVAVNNSENGLEFVDSVTKLNIIFGLHDTLSTRSETGFGVKFKSLGDYLVLSGIFYANWINGTIYTAKLWDASNAIKASGTIIGDGTLSWKEVNFLSPYNIEKFKDYHITLEIASGSISKYYSDNALPTAFLTRIAAYTGLPTSQNAATGTYAAGIKIKL